MKNLINKTSVILLVGLISLTAYPSLNMINTNNVIVGEIYNDFKCTNDFIFVNDGKTDITVFRVMPTCACIIGSNDVSKVKPGQKLTVSTIFDAHSVHGKFSRGLWIITDDPTNQKVLVRISGEVLPLFKGFPEDRIDLSAADETSSFTNTFTFTATTTNFFLNQPTCDSLSNKVECIWAKQTLGTTNIWQLTTIIKPKICMKDFLSIHVPITGPKELSDQLIRFKLAIGVPLTAAPLKLVTSSLEQPFVKRVYINTYFTSTQSVDLLTWEPHINGLTITKEMSARTLRHSKLNTPLSNSKARFDCTISATPEALKELMKMEDPGFTFSYPDHQSTTIPLILYNPADTQEEK